MPQTKRLLRLVVDLTRPKGRKTHVEEDVSRPFRVWDENEKCDVRWRYYTSARRAQRGAILEIMWAKVDTAYTVYDARDGRFIRGFRKGVSSVIVID